MMKNTLIRAFVLMIAVAGFGASTVAASHQAKAADRVADVVTPVPMCAPSDPTHCGLQ